MYKRFFLLIIMGLYAHFSWAAMAIPGIARPKNNTTENVKVDLVATSVTNGNKYEFQLDTSADFNSPVLITGSPSAWITTYSVSNLFFGQKYYWRVRVFNVNRNDSSDWSSAAVFTTRSTFSLNFPANNAVNLNPSNQLSYLGIGSAYNDIQIDTAEDFSSAEMRIITMSDLYTFAPVYFLRFGTKYYWRGRGRTTVDTTEWTAVRNFTTISNPTNNYPANNAISTVAADEFNWRMGSGVTDSISFELLIDTVEDFSSNAARSISIYRFLRAQNVEHYIGKKLYWKVRAYHKADTSEWSSTWQVTNTVNLKLNAPANNTATPQNIMVNFEWYHIYGLKGYLLEIDTSENFSSSEKLSYDIPYKLAFIDNKWVNLPYYGATYYWRMRAYNSLDTGAWSDVFRFITKGEINLLSPASNSTNIHPITTLKWDSLPGSKYYDYELDSSADFNSSLLLSGSITKSSNKVPLEAKVKDLYFGTRYFWRVRARTEQDTSGWSLQHFTTIDTVEQIWPSDGFYSAVDANLWWVEIDGVTGYQYQLGEDSLFTGVPLYTVGADTTQVIWPVKLKTYSPYYWRVRTFHDKDTSAWNTAAFTTIMARPVLLTPINNATNIPTSNTVLDWADVTGADFYLVERGPNMQMTGKTIDTVYISQMTIPTLSRGTTYFWRVIAAKKVSVDDDFIKVIVESDPSDLWRFTAATGFPIEPTLLSPANAAKDVSLYPVLKWASDKSATQYEYAYSQHFDFNFNVTSGKLTDTFVSIGPLAPKKQYYWRVRARNNLGLGPWSEVFRFNTTEASGIEDDLTQDDLLVFPNPAKGSFQIQQKENVKINRLEVRDLQGKLILQLLKLPANAQVSLPETKAGLYLVYIATDKGTSVTRLMVE